MNWLWLKDYFQELLAFENWSKIENINYVIKKYNIKPEDILFIDDNINHINNVKESWVNTLHFSDYNIDIEEYINTLNN
jgi:predicted phosphatase